MNQKGITPKFTLSDLRDNITQFNCGDRGQSHKLYKLDRDLEWNGEFARVKVPVVIFKYFS